MCACARVRAAIVGDWGALRAATDFERRIVRARARVSVEDAILHRAIHLCRLRDARPRHRPAPRRTAPDRAGLCPVVKPLTSRPASSERFVLCVNRRGGGSQVVPKFLLDVRALGGQAGAGGRGGPGGAIRPSVLRARLCGRGGGGGGGGRGFSNRARAPPPARPLEAPPFCPPAPHPSPSFSAFQINEKLGRQERQAAGGACIAPSAERVEQLNDAAECDELLPWPALAADTALIAYLRASNDRLEANQLVAVRALSAHAKQLAAHAELDDGSADAPPPPTPPLPAGACTDLCARSLLAWRLPAMHECCLLYTSPSPRD